MFKPVSLRQMMPADLVAVATIERHVSPTPWEFDIFKKCLVLYSAWVAEYEDNVVGFGIISITDSEAHILNMAVCQQVQRNGIGKQLLEKLLTVARQEKVERSFLEVRASNLAAQRLYQHCDFDKSSIRKDYYKSDDSSEDAWVFVHEL